MKADSSFSPTTQLTSSSSSSSSTTSSSSSPSPLLLPSASPAFLEQQKALPASASASSPPPPPPLPPQATSPSTVGARPGSRYQEVKPLWQQLVLGAFSASVSVIVTNPMDVIKCRLQLQKDSAVGGSSSSSSTSTSTSSTSSKPYYRGFVRGLYAIVRNEGVLTLWSGVEPALYRASTYSAARMGLYEPFKEALARGLIVAEAAAIKRKNTQQQQQQQQPQTQQLLVTTTRVVPYTSLFVVQASAGVLAGAVAAAIGNPFDLIKVRMQAVPTPENLSASQGMVYAFRSIMRDEGVTGLWKGVGMNMARSAVLTTSLISVYDRSKRVVKSTTGWSEGVLVQLVASMLAGVVSTTISTPFDVIKTRLMYDRSDSTQVARYKGTRDCASKLVREEGISALMKGWVPNYMRLGPHTMVTFMVYERLRRWLGWSAL